MRREKREALEIIEMFAMRKIDSAETRKGNPRVRVKIPRTGNNTKQSNPRPQEMRRGRDAERIAVAFSFDL